MNKTQENQLLFLLAAIKFTHIIDFMIIMPLADQFIRAFHINPQQFSYLVSAYTFSAGFATLLAASFLDRFDRRTLLLFCYSGFILGTFTGAISPSFELLMVSRIVTGAFGGVMGAVVLAIVGDAIPAERRGRAYGIVMASFSAAAVLGVPLGIKLAEMYDWRMSFYVIVGVSLLVLVATAMLMPPQRQNLQHPTNRPHWSTMLVAVFNSRNQINGLVFMLLLILSQFMVVSFFAPYMMYNVGFNETEVMYTYLLGGVLTAFSAPMLGRFSDRYGAQKVFIVATICSLLPLYLVTNMNRMDLIDALWMTGLFFIFISGRVIPATVVMNNAVGAAQRGGFMSLNIAIQQLAMGMGSLIAGVIITQSANRTLNHYEYVGYLAIGLTLLSILIVRIITSPPKTAEVGQTEKEIEEQMIDSIGAAMTEVSEKKPYATGIKP
jgi:MFS transporter, DHA1 family, inner membrane transport protein